MTQGVVVSLDAHPRATIDGLLNAARGCCAIADRSDLLRQTRKPELPDAFAYVMKAQTLVIGVYRLRAYLSEEQALLLALIETTIERLCREDDRRMSTWVAPVVELRARQTRM